MKISRQLRRKLNRNGIVKSDIDQIIHSTIDFTISGYEAVLVLALHDKLGFGEKRARRFMKYVRDTFDSVQQGYVSIEDIKDEIKETMNIDIEKEFVEGE